MLPGFGSVATPARHKSQRKGVIMVALFDIAQWFIQLWIEMIT